ncbi:hypothetical protein [Cribrihabitans pelagius]|uniref:hypothetical protein n=1 Tax=Cribrihabitans pelagius TaxID=1765746 RepID=UPI003B5BAE17
MNSFPPAPPCWNRRDSVLSEVPGCRPATIAPGLLRAVSIAVLRRIMFSAALEARWEYQPPSWLSELLLTRVEIVAKTARQEWKEVFGQQRPRHRDSEIISHQLQRLNRTGIFPA